MPCHKGGGGVTEDVQLLPDMTVCVAIVVERAVCQQACTEAPVSIGLVTAIQLVVIQIKGAPAVHCCFEVEQPREDAVTEPCSHLWPLALDQLCCGKLPALHIQVLPEESPASHPKGIACCYHDGSYLGALELARSSKSCCIPCVLAEALHVLLRHCNGKHFVQNS